MTTKQRRPTHESSRDMDESAFTLILRRLWHSSASVLSVAFIDDEGEAIDYCTSMDPFDAKIIGAQMVVTTRRAIEATDKAGFGTLYELTIACEKRDLIVRRVTDELALAICTTTSDADHGIAVAVERCVDALRREAELEAPAWEPRQKPLEVYVREAVGWKYAPALFSEQGGKWIEVVAVLGRWEDDEDNRMCFRVRTREGNEVTLAHDTKLDRWTMLSDKY